MVSMLNYDTNFNTLALAPESLQNQNFDQYQKVLNVAPVIYSTAWRTLSEAIAIAVIAFVFGIVGAVSDLGILAFSAAIILGVVIGSVVKGFWATLIGAPTGVFLGVVIGIFLWATGASPLWVILFMTVGGILGALIGSHRNPGGRNWWERFRPWFGALGAALFVLIGLFVGEGVQQLFRLIMGG
jgi:hypothetical protein